MRSRSSPKVRSFWRNIDSRDPLSGVNGNTTRRNLAERPRRPEFTRAATRREWWRRLVTAGRFLPDSRDCVDPAVFVEVAVFTAGNAGCDINEMASTAAANIEGTDSYLGFINRVATCTAGGAVHLTTCNSELETTLSYVVVQGT